MADYDEYPIYPEKKKKRPPQEKRLWWALSALVLLTLLPLLAALYLSQQAAYEAEQDLLGTWTGTLYQDDGGLKATYPFEMVIKNPDEGRVSVTTTIWLDETHEYYATMGGFGVGAIRTIHFYDVNILNQNPPPGGIWCIKQGQLTLDKGILSGEWKGEAGGQTCAPGRIVLTRSR